MASPASARLRDLVFTLSPEQLKLTPLPGGVWAAMMEFDAGGTWVALAAIVDGTTSLYFGSGGGIIGSGAHPAVREASRAFLNAVDNSAGNFSKVDTFPFPGSGRVHFYALKTDGVYASPEVDEDDARLPGSPLQPLYAAAQDLITQIRLASPQG